MGALCVPAASANTMIKTNSSYYVSPAAKKDASAAHKGKTRAGSAFMVLKYWPLNSPEQ